MGDGGCQAHFGSKVVIICYLDYNIFVNTVCHLKVYGGRGKVGCCFSAYYRQMKKKGEKDVTIFNTS